LFILESAHKDQHLQRVRQVHSAGEVVTLIILTKDLHMILEYKIPARYLFSIVKYELVLVLLVGVTTHFTAISFANSLPDMPLAIPAFLGTSISVLLSFKMNQSYDRWWEARKVWGAIVNDSRSLVIQLQSFLHADHAHIIKRIAYRQIAWCYALGRSLRGHNNLENLDHLISSAELAQISKQDHQPLAILQATTRDLQALRSGNTLDIRSHIHIQETITRLTDSMGSAERIRRTVFPSTYRLVLHFIIYLFVITLAIALKEINNILVIPLLLLISIGFFFIEKIAYHLQDPFRNRPSDVPVTNISETVEKNIRQLLDEAAAPNTAGTGIYYLM
jgi:putative membrane protein